LSMHKHNKFESIFNASLFSVALVFLGSMNVYSCLTTKETTATQENRALAPFPRLRNFRNDISKFTSSFEQYFNDRIAFRLPFIATRNFILYRLFQSSGNSNVGVGKGGWFFYALPSALDVQLNAEPFNESALKEWANMIEARRAVLAKHNIRYVFVIAPEKGSVYPEFYPSTWHKRPGLTRLDSLRDYLHSHTAVDFVDAKSTLLASKNRGERLYYLTDTHWDQLGAFLVAQEILKHVSAYFPDVKLFEPTEYRLIKEPIIGDLVKSLGLEGWLTESSTYLEFKNMLRARKKVDALLPQISPASEPPFAMERSGDKLPRIMVLRDSFGGLIVPFISERASFSEYQMTHKFIPAQILLERPDVVIDEIAERHLYDYSPDHCPNFLAVDDSKTERTSIATFGNKLELVNLTLSKTKNSYVIKALWHSLVKQRLDNSIGLHFIGADSQFEKVNYEQDSFEEEIPSGASWLDTVEIPKRFLECYEQFGMVVDPHSKSFLSVTAKNVDWYSTRALFTIKDIQSNGAEFDRDLVTEKKAFP